MITKEQFLAGVEFRVKGEDGTFMYDIHVKCLNRNFFMNNRHHANIRSVEGDGFLCFKYLFNTKAEQFVSFSDCTLIVNEPETAEIVDHE